MWRWFLHGLSNGEVIEHAGTRCSFQTRWHYDILRALDHLKKAAVDPDDRIQEAVGVVEAKAGPDGRWLLDHTHPGDVHFHMEEEGQPSRWNTLRAMRVLEWASTG